MTTEEYNRDRELQCMDCGTFMSWEQFGKNENQCIYCSSNNVVSSPGINIPTISVARGSVPNIFADGDFDLI